MKIHGFAFCYDFDNYGRRGGYAWTHLRHCIHLMTTVITDNGSIIKTFGEELRLTENEIRKFIVLRQPVEIKADHVYDVNGFSEIDSRRTRPTVLWAGRFHKQKNVDCGLKIAALLPQIDFLFAGGSLNDLPNPSAEVSANVTFLGLYDRFDSLLDRRIDLFLHTADWTGCRMSFSKRHLMEFRSSPEMSGVSLTSSIVTQAGFSPKARQREISRSWSPVCCPISGT